MAHPTTNQGGTYPIFVTRYSLSPKTAIGVQTKQFAEAFKDWRHLHWLEFGSPFRGDRRSIRLGNALVGKWPHYAAKVREVPGLRRWAEPIWTGNVLNERLCRELVAKYQDRASALYVAPVDDVDAGRMRFLVKLFDRPFVLHLWDSLERPLLQSEDQRWLIQHAHQVLTLSRPLQMEVRTLRPDVSELLFVREPTMNRARAPALGEPLRVALIGFLPAYRTGLHLLHEAYGVMEAAGLRVKLHFVGSKRALRRLNEPAITRNMQASGHLESDAARDAALARCHVAFLPGPLEAPERDMRSRYSIPSRVLDFMAVGLPVVGAVHPQSATAQFCEEYGIGEHVLCGNSQQIVAALTALRDASEWQRAHHAGLQALERVDRTGQLKRLKAAMASAAAV